MVRTYNEDRCMDCGAITNFYAADMGRLCPHCTARRMAEFGEGLERWQNNDYLSLPRTLTESEIREICADKTLFDEPLIDHSNDIDKQFKKGVEIKNE